MRKVASIVVATVVAASCIPQLRHQPFFSVVVAIIAVALAGILVFGGVRALSSWSRRKGQQGDSTQSGWLSQRFRNLSLGATLIILLMLTVPHFMATNSGAYKLAIATAHQSPQFSGSLGAPITEAWFSEGKEELGNPATATLLIPVHGQKGDGILRAQAIKDGGLWRLTELTLELNQPEERIDLLRSTPMGD